ncbi:pitrilysin family protein [Limnothrix sp. FACHB-881]|uniref:M16 family metallopeptidase n=1 Tax=Limnothrix sp. FACHB-881 TaxID=2692819 RepID=UPI001F556730|nr:pitrilysin family protein [Limnothrix sp. FACHB-881]
MMSPSLFAPALPPIETVRTGPLIRRLDCGALAIVEQMPVEAVNLSLWVNAGSAIEPEPINGMAHFLEHMVFKGSDRLALGEFEQRIEACGAVTNAATSQDYTQFYLTAAPQDFAALAPLQFDVALRPQLPAAEFDRERHVVLEEIRRSQDNPRRRTFQAVMNLAFETLPYNRPVLGPTEVIAHLDVQQMRDFHDRHYRPQSVTAVAVGNLPPEQLFEILETGFNEAWRDRDWSGLPVATPSLIPELPFDRVERREIIDPSLQQARLIMLWRVPGLQDLRETYPLDVLAAVLGHGRTSRLVRDLREERRLVSKVSATNLTYRAQGTFYLAAHCEPEHLPELEARLQDHMARIGSEPVSMAEVDRVRARVANGFVFGNETPANRSNLYGYYQTLVGNVDAALRYPDAVRCLTPEDLQRAAQQYLNPQAYGLVILRPAAAQG